MEKRKLSPAYNYMSLDQRKVVLTAKLKSLLEYSFPLLLAQPQNVRQKAEVISMKINRWILQENTLYVRNETICKKLNCPTPAQAIVNCSAKFIHKLITTDSTPSLSKFISKPRRITAQHHYKFPKKKSNKTSIETLTTLYNQMHIKEKSMKPKALKRCLKKIKLKYKPQD